MLVMGGFMVFVCYICTDWEGNCQLHAGILAEPYIFANIN